MTSPDPEAVATAAALAHELRVLRVHCGSPSVRELARRADIDRPGSLPHSTAQDALTGSRGLPKLEVVLSLVKALGVADPAPWRAAWTRAKLDHQGLAGPLEDPPGGQAQFRATLIDVVVHHYRRDIGSCGCGEWGVDHGHLGQCHAAHVADIAMGRLATAGYEIVPAETGRP